MFPSFVLDKTLLIYASGSVLVSVLVPVLTNDSAELTVAEVACVPDDCVSTVGI